MVFWSPAVGDAQSVVGKSECCEPALSSFTNSPGSQTRRGRQWPGLANTNPSAPCTGQTLPQLLQGVWKGKTLFPPLKRERRRMCLSHSAQLNAEELNSS